MRKKKIKRMLLSIGSLVLSGTLISICLIAAFTLVTKTKDEANKDAALAKWESYQEALKQKEEENKSASEKNVTVTQKDAINDGIHTTSEQQTRREMENLMKKISSETAGSDPR